MGLSGGEIAGIVVGVFFLILLIFFLYKFFRPKNSVSETTPLLINGPTPVYTEGGPPPLYFEGIGAPPVYVEGIGAPPDY